MPPRYLLALPFGEKNVTPRRHFACGLPRLAGSDAIFSSAADRIARNNSSNVRLATFLQDPVPNTYVAGLPCINSGLVVTVPDVPEASNVIDSMRSLGGAALGPAAGDTRITAMIEASICS